MIMLSQDDSNEIKEILHLIKQHLAPKEQYILSNIEQRYLRETINTELSKGSKYIQHILTARKTDLSAPKYMIIFERNKADN